MKNKKVILTYGTFDMYHLGHRNVIKNSKLPGYELYVGVATDEYVKDKNKNSLLNYEMRKSLIESDELVDKVITEEGIFQWANDFSKFSAEKIRISIEHKALLENNPEVANLNIEYFDRTPDISTTQIKNQLNSKKVVLTYGTFDLLHKGHINIFKEAKKLGDILIVGVSTDEFNKLKSKSSHENFSKRIKKVLDNEFVDFVIPEISWEQKSHDIKKLNVDYFVMGSDWDGKFDDILDNEVEIKIIKRTDGISSTLLREKINKKINEKS